MLLKEVLSSTPRSEPAAFETPKDQKWWLDGSKADPTSYYEAEWSSLTPGTQNRVMKNKTDLANTARSEASMTECALYTLSLKRSEDASAAGAPSPQSGSTFGGWLSP